jgi:hypothetical protein
MVNAIWFVLRAAATLRENSLITQSHGGRNIMNLSVS